MRALIKAARAKVVTLHRFTNQQLGKCSHILIDDLQTPAKTVSLKGKTAKDSHLLLNSLCEGDMPSIFQRPGFIMFTHEYERSSPAWIIFNQTLAHAPCQSAEHNHKSQGEIGSSKSAIGHRSPDTFLLFNEALLASLCASMKLNKNKSISQDMEKQRRGARVKKGPPR